MTKNQFMALKPGDKVKCGCGGCRYKIWTMVERLEPGLILATSFAGNPGTLACSELLEREHDDHKQTTDTETR